MANKPGYIKDLEEKVEQLDSKYDIIISKLNTINICLKGTEFDEDEGGLVKKVNQNSKCIGDIKSRMAKRDGIIATLSGIMTALITLSINWLLNKGD